MCFHFLYYMVCLYTGSEDMMEGVEEGLEEAVEDSMFESPEKILGIVPDSVEAGGALFEGIDGTAPQAALSHSLPAHLRLDPVKMQQMRALFFVEGICCSDTTHVFPLSAPLVLYGWSHFRYLHLPFKFGIE